jgi:hypothetical protein
MVMGPSRPYWKGFLKLSLVSCPIALYPGTSSTERVSFRQINKRTGNRLRQQLVDEATGEVIQGNAKGRGFEYAKNAYVQIDDDELDAIARYNFPEFRPMPEGSCRPINGPSGASVGRTSAVTRISCNKIAP